MGHPLALPVVLPKKTAGSRLAIPCLAQIDYGDAMPADLLHTLRGRGLLGPLSDEAAVSAYLAAGPATAYAAIDPTTDSLQGAQLLLLMPLMHLQRAGHGVSVVLGAAAAAV